MGTRRKAITSTLDVRARMFVVKTAKPKRRGMRDVDALGQLRQQWPAESTKFDIDFVEFIGGIAMIDQLIEREFKRIAHSQFAMTPGDIRVLFALRRAGRGAKLRPIEIFKRLLVTSGAVTKQLDRLEVRGFVRRVFKRNKVRSSLVELTDEGRSLADEAITAVAALPVTRAAFYSLSESNRASAMRIIHLMIKETEKHITLHPID
jgi:DNA-binding MarR family transcriptional regulator